MAEPDLPTDEQPASDGGERRSRERLARPTRVKRLRWRARALLDRALGPMRSPKRRVDAIRRLIAPLVLAAVPLYWVADATYRATLTTIGRDQGIFQYIAWAVLQGDVDYRDVRDVNGPLVHLIHMIMLGLGGADEHRFHVIDMVATGASFAIVGALLPGVLARRTPTLLERAGWALAGWVVLAGQYGLYLYWNQAQRESFCDWFLLPSIALQAARPANDERAASRRVVAIAALSTITWFGKPSFVLFTAMQLAVLLVDREIVLSWRARLASFVVGGALGAAIPVVYLLRYGDVLAYLQITLRDVPSIYRFIWARSAPEILGDEGPLGSATFGLAIAAVLVALVVMRSLPRRALVMALAPVVGVLVAVLQHKGFDYHFHPLTATTHMGLMLVVIMLWERFRGAPRSRPTGRWLALGLTGAYALFVASSMRSSPHTRNVWILAGGETPEKRSLQEYFDTFKSHDFFPWDLRQGASWIAEKTRPDARVQMYAMDPYLLFLARRRSATPYIYAYDLNADAALDGGWNNRPTWLEGEHIKAVRAAHERDMLARLKEAPPEAFVFVDRSPLMSYGDAWEDFRHCCAETAFWVGKHYHPARTFGEVHVWLRDDMPVPDVEPSVIDERPH
jgi:hypothetical protein